MTDLSTDIHNYSRTGHKQWCPTGVGARCNQNVARFEFARIARIKNNARDSASNTRRTSNTDKRITSSCNFDNTRIFASPLTERSNGCIGDDERWFKVEEFAPFVVALSQLVGERTWTGDVVIEFTVKYLEDEFVMTMATTKFAECDASFMQHAHD